jgi:hypothetical protein
VSTPLAPLAVFVVLLGAVLPPIHKVIEAGIEYGPQDIQGRWSIVEDAWLEVAKHISASKGSQGVLLFPACVVVEFLEIGQVFGQVPDLIVGVAEALYFGAKGLVPFLLDSKIDHGREGFPGEEGVRLLTGEDSAGIGVFPCPEGTQVAGAVASSQEEEFGVIGEEVVPVKRGLNRPSSQPGDSIVVLWCHPLDVSVPVISRYNPKFFHDFGGGHAWVIVKVWRWRPWVWLVWDGCPWWSKEVEFLDRHLWISNDEQLVHIGHGRTTGGFTGVVERMELGVVSKDLYDPMKDRPSWGLRGLVILPRNEDTTADCSGRGIEDVRGGVPGLTVITEHLYGDAEELSVPFSFVVAIIGLIAGVEHRDSSYDVCGMYRRSLYLSKGIFIWRERCGLTTRGGVVEAVVGGRHERERMSLRSRSLLLLTVWTFPP